jgi:Flp pilus assembly protein TadD/ADP-heptose:LPS heptosyltransferase
MTSTYEALAAGWRARNPQANPLPDRLAQAPGDGRPTDAELLGMFGMIANQAGRHELAAHLLGRAVQMKDDSPTLYFQLGVASQGLGRLDEAVASLQRTLSLQPDHPEARQLLTQALANGGPNTAAPPAPAPAPDPAQEHTQAGVRFVKENRLAEAEASFREAIKRKPELAEAHDNLGVVFARQGRLPEAEASFRLAILMKPSSATGHANLGMACLQRGKPPDAEMYFRQSIQLNPELTDTYMHLSMALIAQKKWGEAETSLREVLKRRPDAVDAHWKFANVVRSQGKTKEAEAALREVVRLKPDHADAYNSLGILLEEQGNRADAVAAYHEALKVRPEAAEYHSNLGVALAGQDRLDEAEAAYRESLRLKPDAAATHNNLGNTLRMQGRLEEAAAALREALRLRPDYAEAHNNLGIALLHHGIREQGLACYDEAIRLRPDYPEAHLNRALAWLGAGDFARGWPEYEWRWRGRHLRPRQFPQPRWDGGSLEGKTVLLTPEQGLGDALQFARYAAVLRARGAARVVLEAPEPLADLLTRTPGVDEVVPRNRPLPPFDVHCPMLSVPGLVGTGENNIPAAVPYVFPDPARVAHWARELIGLDGLRVGIAWQGNPQHRGDKLRSVRLERFAALAAIPGVRLCAVQKGAGREQLTELAGRFPIEDLGGALSDSMADTAGLFANLDLIITVDTAVAHLAGGMGVPVWVPLPTACDWRWLRGREDSPWYPSLRLFRQQGRGEWDPVFGRLEEELRRLAEQPRLERPAVPEPATAEEWHQAGLAQFRRGRLEEAVASFERAVVLKPEAIDLYNSLGVAQARLKRFPEAVASFRRALEAKPDSAAVLSNLGLAYLEQGQKAEAEAVYRDLVRVNPASIEAQWKLANVLRNQGKPAEAEAALREIVRLKPDHVDAFNSLGILLEEQGKGAEAVDVYHQALKIRPDSPEIYSNLGVALAGQERLDEAEAAYRESLRLKPDAPATYNNLGNTLRMRGRLEEGDAALREAIRLKPDYAEAYNNLAVVLVQDGKLEEAVAGYTESLRLRPDYPEAHLNRALCWLGMGDFAHGWEEYEWRWKGRNFKPRQCEQPLWDGSPLEGKTVLLTPEQGLGDVIQFARYAAVLHERGAGRIVLESPEPLVDLLARTPGIDAVVPRNRPLPAFDVHCPMLGVPRLVCTDIENIPANVPYLFPDPARVAHWARELEGLDGLRVGIAWQGNPQHRGDKLRSVRLERFAALAAIPGVRLCAVQKGAGREQLDELHGRFPVEDFGKSLADSMADTAGLFANLDLIITVDTAVAHLAGGMGVPVWVPLPTACDWRWLRGREDNPWYPTLRLFRQAKHGDWDGVFERLVEELRRRAEQPRPERPAVPEPVTVDEWHQTGLAQFRRGRLEEAVASFERAVALKPESADLYNSLGVAQARLKRFPEAVASFRRVLEAKPDAPAVLSNLGLAHLEQGQKAEAEACYRELLHYHPDSAETHLRLANVLRNQGKLAEAEGALREVVRLKPGHVDAHNSLGILLEEQGKAADAVTAYREALKLRPEAAEIHSNLGVALAAQEKLKEAEAAYRDSIRLRPDSAATHNNLGNTLRMQGRHAEAEASLREAIRLRPDYAEAQNNLGIVLIHQGRREEGMACYDEALRLRPNYPEAHNNRGIVLADDGRVQEAFAAYDDAVGLRPDYPEAHLNRALCWLSAGDFARGWAEYEWRWKGRQLRPRQCPQPRWDGGSLEGKTVLLTPEQGLGDTLQFARYAAVLRDRGVARVIVEAPEPLAELLSRTRGIDEVATRGRPLPVFDLYCPLMSIPGLVGTNEHTIPAEVPYLFADPGRVAHWARELAGLDGLRVGIAWQGNPQHRGDSLRSVKLERFAGLAAIPGVRLCAVQKGAGREQLDELRGRFPLEDLGKSLSDSVADTAALFANLDLLITIDTAVAHLAGGLGMPAWVALPTASDWRWLRGREDSPWYPSLRLFRQQARGDWDGVFGRLEEELRGLAEQPRPGRTAAPATSTAEEWHQAGLAQFRRGRLEEAAASFERAVTLKPEAIDLYNSLGVTQARLKRFPEAVVSFKRVLEAKPGSAAVLSNLGLAYLESGQWDDAEAAYREMLRLQPDSVEAQKRLASLLRGPRQSQRLEPLPN